MDDEEEMMWIRPDLLVPIDPIRHLVREIKAKYGKEEGQKRIDETIARLKKNLKGKADA